MTSILYDQTICLICLSVENECDTSVIWVFGDKTKDDIFSWCGALLKVILCLCYIKKCCLAQSVILRQLHSFLTIKNAGDLVRNFVTQTFASSHVPS